MTAPLSAPLANPLPAPTFAALGELFAHHAARTPHACAVQFEGQRHGYAEMAHRTGQFAQSLRTDYGVQTGDRVAYLGFNHVDQLCLLIALAQLGAILVPLNYRLAPAEWQALLTECRPCLLLHDAAWADAALALGKVCSLPVAEVSTVSTVSDAAVPPSEIAAFGPPPPPAARPNAPVLLVYTSGTTGQPKGALHTQANIMANMCLSATLQSLSATDVVATILPLFHVGGLCIQTLPALWAGACVVLHPRFDATAFFQTLADSRPTLTLHVPATLRALVDHPAWASADLRCLRALWAGSSPIPADLIAAVHQRGVPVCNVYGATETGPVSIALPPGYAASHVGSCGWPTPGVEAKLQESPVPELLLRGPNIIDHYFDPDFDRPRPANSGQTPSSTATSARDADGWFHTGDLAQRAADGSYTIIGRAKDMLISGGENIYPAEIENLLQTHPQVADCAVIGLPDAQWGERVVAVVVLNAYIHGNSMLFGIPCKQSLLEQCEQITLDLTHYLSQHLARYKLPREWKVVDALPKTALGKVQKTLLRDRLLRA